MTTFLTTKCAPKLALLFAVGAGMFGLVARESHAAGVTATVTIGGRVYSDPFRGPRRTLEGATITFTKRASGSPTSTDTSGTGGGYEVDVDAAASSTEPAVYDVEVSHPSHRTYTAVKYVRRTDAHRQTYNFFLRPRLISRTR